MGAAAASEAPAVLVRRPRHRRRTPLRTGAVLVVTLAACLAVAASTLTAGTDAADDRALSDEDAWCSYLSSQYLSFPAPWTARIINCSGSAVDVAAVRSDGTVGDCVTVPARHSRHLGGTLVAWVTDTRPC